MNMQQNYIDTHMIIVIVHDQINIQKIDFRRKIVHLFHDIYSLCFEFDSQIYDNLYLGTFEKIE